MTAKLPKEAFSFYVALGPARSYQKVAEHFGTDKRTVTRRATKENWPERLLQAEEKAREETEQDAVLILREMNARHLKIAKALQGKALEALRSLPIDRAADVIRALEIGVKQERLIHGEPSERSEMSVEEVTKRELSRWLVLGGGDDDEAGAA
jgi:hypothetical protein